MRSFLGKCGCCWAFTNIACVESVYLRFAGVSLDLAEQQLVDCAPNIDNGALMGCSGGVVNYGMEYILKNGESRKAP